MVTGLERVRVEQGLTTSELARRAGISRETIRRIERGGMPRVDTAARLGACLSLSPRAVIELCRGDDRSA